MNPIEIISASAGSGKTYRLASQLESEIASGRVRPEAILATTFTNKAAAELEQRVRARLLASGHVEAAHRLGGARIGTVNAVCGRLVSEFAFELGLSPELVLFDEVRSELELRRALTSVVGAEQTAELESLRERLPELDWRAVVRRIVDLARANQLDSTALSESAAKSREGFLGLLGRPEADAARIDSALAAGLEDFLAKVDRQRDTTKATQSAIERAEDARHVLRAGRRLPWSQWAGLAKLAPGAKSRDAAQKLMEAASAHDRHPLLRADSARLIELCFELASRALEAYAEHKRQWGAIDFIDQEALAIRLLGREDVRERLAESLDLVLVDEFQDTSPLQLAIFLSLARLARRSIWVGDQKQAIFGFRGTDPALMDAAVAHILGENEPETLPKSWRSRPPLVELTSDLFSRAFLAHGIPETGVRLAAASAEPAGLGTAFEQWQLATRNRPDDLAALAAGVQQLLADPTRQVRDRATGAVRRLHPGDVAVLCYTNADGRLLAAELEALGIPAEVARTGLTATAEGRLVIAGLRLFVDERDALAAAELARLVEHASDPDGLLARILAKPGAEAFAESAFHRRIVAARGSNRYAGALAAFDLVLEAVDARERCLRWGDAERRLANLDALRACAVRYVTSAAAGGSAASVAGLVGWLEELPDAGGDDQAAGIGGNAVVVATWHGSKGLEWPVTVLFGGPRSDSALGVNVAGDRDCFDAANPLAGRWIRYWPNPYDRTTGTPFEQRLGDAAETSDAERRSRAQNLRLLYVGWTRARDVLVLAGRGESLSQGFLGLLEDRGTPLLGPVSGGRASWGGRSVEVVVRTLAPVDGSAVSRVPGSDVVAAGPRAHPPAHLAPSALDAPGVLGEEERIGSRIALSGSPEMDVVGNVVHGFLAADRPELSRTEREAIARGLLTRWGVPGALQPAELLAAGDALIAWVERRWPGARWRREWPVQMRRADGTVVRGTIDLLLETEEGAVIIDHKSFPGTIDQTRERAPAYAGQLGAYAAAFDRVAGLFVHFPVQGAVFRLNAASEEVRSAG